MIQDNPIDAATNNITIPVVLTDRRIISGKCLIEISLYINAKTKEYKTAIAEASVAVKNPATIPPITTISINKLGSASSSFLVPWSAFFLFLTVLITANIAK